ELVLNCAWPDDVVAPEEPFVDPAPELPPTVVLDEPLPPALVPPSPPHTTALAAAIAKPPELFTRATCVFKKGWLSFQRSVAGVSPSSLLPNHMPMTPALANFARCASRMLVDAGLSTWNRYSALTSPYPDRALPSKSTFRCWL